MIPLKVVSRSDFSGFLKVFTTLTCLSQTMAWRSHGTTNEELISKLRGKEQYSQIILNITSVLITLQLMPSLKVTKWNE